MTLTDPELLRATVPSKALRFFGRALREKSFDREIYHLSSTTEKALLGFSRLLSCARYMLIKYVLFDFSAAVKPNKVVCNMWICSATLK